MPNWLEQHAPRDRTTIEVRTDLLSALAGLSYTVVAERRGFSTLELTRATHGRVLTRLLSVEAPPPPKSRRVKGRR